MKILLIASHAVAEYDDVRMFSDLGYDVFAPGGYAEPAHPSDDIRPAIPDAPDHPELRALCDAQREKHTEGDSWAIDWAKADLHPELVEWADVIIVHHFPERWIAGQWERIRHKRVIWRTCGQSTPDLERMMCAYHEDGLQIVRYSPAERRYFEPQGAWAGQDALIRFGKYPDDYGPYIGDLPVVGNVTQDLWKRGADTGLAFWLAATKDLPTKPAGQGSEVLGGLGRLPYPAMLDYLRHIRAYLYTGTKPASYTLGLIEAMLSGVPVVSITPGAWDRDAPDLFEGHEFAYGVALGEPVRVTHSILRDLLDFDDKAAAASREQCDMAIAYFGIERIGRRWADYLEGRQLDPEPSVSHFPSQRELVPA